MSINSDQKIIEMYASIGKLITSSLDINSVLQGIMEEIRLFFNPENWSLLIYDEKEDELSFLIAKGLDLDQIKDLRIKGGEGIAGKVVKDRVPVFIPDTRTGPNYSRKVDERTGFVTKSIIAVPILFQDRAYGVLEIVNRQGGEPFTSEESIVLRSIADFAGIAFSNVSLHDETSRLARYDTLTGAMNRTSLNEFVSEIRNSSSEVIIISIDLDRFKEINDTLGHGEGDKALRFFGKSLREKFEKVAKIFRIGGDEFLIINVLQESETVERMIQVFRSLLYEVKMAGQERTPAIHFSYGINHGPGNKIGSLLYETDLLMYSHKHNSD